MKDSMKMLMNYAKQHDIPLSGIVCHPIYDEKKGRVTKGKSIPHREWNKINASRKKRYIQSRVDKTILGSIAKAWYIDLRSAGMYIIDIDTKNGKKAEDVMDIVAWDLLFQASNYVIRTGSGGAHFYFKVPEGVTNVRTRTKSEKFNQFLEDTENGDIDILFDSVIIEGSSYELNGKTYLYQAIKGTIEDVTECSEVWVGVQQECEIVSNSDYNIAERPSGSDEVEEYLQAIPTIKLSYQEWVKVGFVIYNELGRNGKGLFVKWSETYPNNDYNETHRVWESIIKSTTRKEKALFGSLKRLLREKDEMAYYALENKYNKFNKECLVDLNQSISEIKDENVRIVCNDKMAGDIIWEELKNKLVFSNKTFYCKENNCWTDDIQIIERSIRRYVMSSNLYRHDIKGRTVPYAQNATSAQNIVKVIMDNAVAYRDDLWESKTFESSRGKILFMNGYYDMKEGQFITTDSELFDSSVVFMEHIPYEYDILCVEPEYVNNLYQRFFIIPFGEEMGLFYLLKLARAIAGDAEKKFLAGIGSSNTGKSALTSILSNALGGYFGAWNGANICYKSSSQDEAQKLRWLYLLRHKRIIVSNELQTGGLGIDGNMIKKLSNGGLDHIVAREHNSNELSFKIGFLPILFAQDIDKIRPMDDAVMTRVRAVHYQKIYVDEPTNEFELKIDRNLEMEVQTHHFRMGFIELLCKTYKDWHEEGRDETEPESVKHTVKEVIGSHASIIDCFQDEFEITNCSDDFVTSAEIEKWLTDGKYHVTGTKFGLEMKKYITVKKLENVKGNQVKKIKGKSVKVWKGIRRYEEVEESDVKIE